MHGGKKQLGATHNDPNARREIVEKAYDFLGKNVIPPCDFVSKTCFSKVQKGFFATLYYPKEKKLSRKNIGTCERVTVSQNELC